MGIFDKFKKGFQKSASAFSSGLKEIIIKKEIDDENLNKIEEFLIQSDVGIEAASEIKEIISTKKVDPNKDLKGEINLILRDYIISLMKPLENTSFFLKKEKLNATLISGVNGVGKTTSIGKIGKILKTNGNKVMFAASDTFRAAAIEQLENWANKIDVQITKSSQGSDPASVTYKAVEEAINNNFNHVLIDTAGRLQNRSDLMEQLKKIYKVIESKNNYLNQKTIMIIDGTTGQSSIKQVEEFSKYAKIDGLILSKLDGSAVGGTIISIIDHLKVPILGIGIGENKSDLEEFNAKKFIDRILKN